MTTAHPNRPIPSPSPGDLHLLAARYGIEPDAIRALPQGVANHTIALGPDLVLRIPRDEGPFLDDLRKESVVIPLAAAAGAPVPAVVAWEEGRHIAPWPFMVQRRLPGMDLAHARLDDPAVTTSWESAGAVLATLHQTPIPDLTGDIIPVDLPTDQPSDHLARMARDGIFDRATIDTLEQLLGRLPPFAPERIEPVLIHGDIADRNVLVTPGTGKLTGLIDWGDSALADPAQDFAKLPLPFLLPALGGYLGTMGASPSGLRLWQARTFRYHLEWGIAAANQRDAEGHPLGGATHERLAGVLRFLSMTADPRWSWLGRF